MLKKKGIAKTKMTSAVKKATLYIFASALLTALFFASSCVKISAKDILVSQDGTGHFTTIQEAVNFAANGDTIKINSGTYTEPVFISGKTLNLVGTGAATCMITYPTDNYLFVPLFIQSGSVKNLTIYGHGKPNGYTVHIDNPYQSNKRLSFSNCNIISNGGDSCLGIGMYGGSNIYFDNCTLSSDNNVLFYHNNNTNNYPGYSSISFYNCTLNSTGTQSIRKQIFNTNNMVNLYLNGSTVNCPAEKLAAAAKTNASINTAIPAAAVTNSFANLTAAEITHTYKDTLEASINELYKNIGQN